MRAAAILGPENAARALATFQGLAGTEWTSLIEQADAAVIFGGDGTVHRNLAELMELDIPVLVVPSGSGNDFARALNLRSLKDAVEAWKGFVSGQTTARSIDLGVISPIAQENADQKELHYFCCVAGVGIDAEITRRANNLPKWVRAHGGYALSAPGEFIRFAPFPMKVSANGASNAGFKPTLIAAVANAPTFGGGMKIAPQAKLDDGKLDLCTVRGMNVLKLFCLFPAVYFGRHLNLEEVEYEQTPCVRIETECPLDVYADGEFVCQTPVEFSVARGALKVIGSE